MRSIVFWLTTLAVITFLVAGFLHPVSAFTQDLGRHLLMGEIISDTHSVPKTNLLSYTYPNFPFINHHYLSEVLFYIITQIVGINGLLIFMTVIVVSAWCIVFGYAVKKTHILPVAILSFFYLKVLFERTDIRPEMFGFFFLSIFIVHLYRYREKFSPWILLLIPLELFWVQLHISFIIGIVVMGLFVCDNFILHRKNLNNTSTKFLIFTFLASTLLTLLNPNGVSGALYPFHIFQNYGYTIEENQNIFFLESIFFKPTIPYFKLSVLFLFVALIASLKKTKPIDWFLAITFTVLAASAVRNFPLFVFATFIPAATAFNEVLRWIRSQLPPSTFLKYTSIVTPLIMIFIFLWNIPSVTAMRGFGMGVRTGAEKAADFYLAQKLHGPVFNNFDIGSYLESRIYPSQKVFIDGRPEAYPVSFFKDVYIPMQQDPKIFLREEKRYNFSTIFFSHTDQTPWASEFLLAISQNKSWIPVYLDHDVIIFVKNTKQNETVITLFGKSAETIEANHRDEYSQNELLQLLNFYLTIHQQPQAITLAKEISAKDPKNCQILSFLLSTLSQSPAESSWLYLKHYQAYCQ